MTPIKRNGIVYLYVPLQSGGVKLRTTGTGDKLVTRGMKRMLAELKDQRRWKLLAALVSKPARLTLGALYDAYSYNGLDALEASLSASALAPHITRYCDVLRGQGRADKHVGNVERHLRELVRVAPTTADLTPDVVSTWIAGLKTSPGTRRQWFYSATGFARYLFTTARILPTFPLAGMVAPKKNDARMRYESQANDQRIVDAASPKYRAALAFVKATGCDVGTVLRTLRRDIDLERGMAELKGKKTKRRRVFRGIIEPWALPYLREHCAGMLPNAHVWPTGKGKPGKHGRHETPYYTVDGIGSAHDSACEAVQIEDYTLKDARHSVAVRMAEAHYSPFEIAAQIGTSVKLVEEVYAQFDVKLEPRVTESVTPPQSREAK